MSNSCPFSNHLYLHLHYYSEILQQAKELIKAMKENKVKLFLLLKNLNTQVVSLVVYAYDIDMCYTGCEL